MDITADFTYFESKLPELLKEHKGQYVLIREQAIYGYFPSLEEALQSAYQQFGDTDFLIQEITDEIRTNYINSAFIA